MNKTRNVIDLTNEEDNVNVVYKELYDEYDDKRSNAHGECRYEKKINANRIMSDPIPHSIHDEKQDKTSGDTIDPLTRSLLLDRTIQSPHSITCLKEMDRMAYRVDQR